MSEKMSTGLANYLLAGGGDLKTAFATGEIRIYSGTPPATSDAALSGNTLLCTVKNGTAALTFGTASGGVMAKTGTETWSGTNAATGTASFYRLVNSADDGTLSTSLKRIQGTIGAGGADLNVGSVALVSAAVFTINYFTQAFVPS